jgi:hypothetical protein
MRAIRKISWKKDSQNNWKPYLKLATEDGFEQILLREGRELDFEILDRRRCTGYLLGIGERVPCPEFREIESGSQCSECRGKDVYSDYISGNGSPNVEADFSVYLAQCGSEIKVGVTRTQRLMNRWIEQGADYAAEIVSEVSAEEALSKEQDLSENDLVERIRKEHKTETCEDIISDKLEVLGFDAEVLTVHGDKDFSCESFSRKGRFPRPIKHVKGQLVSDGRNCLAMSSGKVMVKSRQKGLSDF